MSGGHFDYNQYKILNIADEIQELIDNNHSEELNHLGYRIGREYSEEVIREFKSAIHFLHIAKIYAHRVDWLISGDDSEEAFLSRLNKELNEKFVKKNT